MVSRRDFMKGLGLASAGLGGAALVAPNFHDLDELASSTNATQKRPWYVKERELFNPTDEVDWAMMKRYDQRNMGQMAHIKAVYYGRDRVMASSALGTAAQTENLKNNVPGFGHRWRALRDSYARSIGYTPTWSGPTGMALGKTPADWGIPKWTGTPEEASKMMRAAAIAYGAALVGYNEFEEKWRTKLIKTHFRGDSGNKYIDEFPPPAKGNAVPIVFEDVAQGYDTDSKWVIPNHAMWLMSISSPEPRQNDKPNPSALAKTNLWGGKLLTYNVYPCIWNFTRTLGYQMIGRIGDGEDVSATGASTVLTGVAESARQNNYVLTPEYGCYIQPNAYLTDLPLAPTPPIDAGLWRFCQTCKKCAETCPPGALDMRNDPSWDLPPVEGKPDTQHSVGVKHYWFNGSLCSLWCTEVGHACSRCCATCTFSVNQAAMVHDIVKGTISNTSVFNSFFFSMAKNFGYGVYEDPETWWDLSLPALGIDTTVASYDKGYKK
jgi:reductive dehalogenase